MHREEMIALRAAMKAFDYTPNLILRRARRAVSEGWSNRQGARAHQRAKTTSPDFETRRFAALLRMRVVRSGRPECQWLLITGKDHRRAQRSHR